MNYRASLPRKQLTGAAFGTLTRLGEGRAHDKLVYSGQHEFLSFANVDAVRLGRTGNSAAAEIIEGSEPSGIIRLLLVESRHCVVVVAECHRTVLIRAHTIEATTCIPLIPRQTGRTLVRKFDDVVQSRVEIAPIFFEFFGNCGTLPHVVRANDAAPQMIAIRIHGIHFPAVGFVVNMVEQHAVAEAFGEPARGLSVFK